MDVLSVVVELIINIVDVITALVELIVPVDIRIVEDSNIVEVDSPSSVVSFNCSLVDVFSVVFGQIADIVDVFVSVLFFIDNKEVEDCNLRVVVVGFP